MKTVFTIATLLLLVLGMHAQNLLEVDGNAWIANKLHLHPFPGGAGEWIENTDWLTLGFYTASLERLKILNDGRIIISVMDTITTAKANVVRQTDGTLAVRQYKIGDLVQGGIVFWVDETGEHGLVVDTADISTDINWSSNDSTVTGATGGSVALESVEGKGAGVMNTMLIVAKNPAGTSAAKLCSDLVRGDYGDWYLPSKGELHLMFVNRTAINATAIAHGGNGFASDNYWSSTERNDNSSWNQNFSSGSQGFGQKSHNYRVRAVRAF